MKLKQLPDLLAVDFICECAEAWESDYSQAICPFGNFSHPYLTCTQGFDINSFRVGLLLHHGLFDPNAVENSLSFSIDLDELITV